MRSLKPASGLPHYETELKRLRIPYAILGGVSAVEGQVLESLRNILSLLVYPGDARALLSILENKPLDIPDREVMVVFRAADRKLDVGRLFSEDVLGAIEDPAVRNRLVSVRELLEALGERG